MLVFFINWSFLRDDCFIPSYCIAVVQTGAGKGVYKRGTVIIHQDGMESSIQLEVVETIICRCCCARLASVRIPGALLNYGLK